MKRTTAPKITEGRRALIANVEMYHKQLKGLISKWSNKRLLANANPIDRDTLKSNL